MKKFIKPIAGSMVLTFALSIAMVLESQAASSITVDSFAESVECSGSPYTCIEIEVVPGTRPIVFLKGAANIE